MRLHCILLLLLTLKVYCQTPRNAKFYLDNKQVSQTAKDFYSGKFKASDNEKTFSILDSMATKNDSTRPFYIYLVSKILYKVDGALSESLGNTCKNFFEQHPDNLIDFLYSGSKLIGKTFMDNWAKTIAYEFITDCEGHKQLCIEESKRVTLMKTKSENKTRLTRFYSKINNYSQEHGG